MENKVATKKTKSKNVVSECSPCAVGDYKPRLYLDLQDQDIKQLKGLSVGDKVDIVLQGTVKGISQRERQDYDDSKKVVKTGSIDLEDYTIQVVEDEKNEFVKMADED